jgi:hypothetical protein
LREVTTPRTRHLHATRTTTQKTSLGNGATSHEAELETADADTRTITYEKADEEAWKEIEAHLRAMPPYDMQDLVAGLLKALGYHIEWVSPPGRDAGIDIIAHTDPPSQITERQTSCITQAAHHPERPVMPLQMMDAAIIVKAFVWTEPSIRR